MLFNSLDFALFLPVVFILYWFVANRNLKFQNVLIVASSYLFYGWWDWRFLSLILFSTVIDYLIGRGLSIQDNLTKRKILLWTSVFVNLGFLGFFKYYNFFIENFVSAFSFFGQELNVGSLDIVLPVGISFYTFQTLSYTIDVYKKKLEPTKDFVAFTAFVSFFPQLVAGPIERASNLLPQFYKKRNFDYYKAVDGMRQVLWGLFKKVVIADNCAEYVNMIFNHSTDFYASTLLLGAVLFAFQIYCDFSGYSDIAIGVSRLFGFNLKQNFAFPYFSRDIAEFWRRWHISLSTWFRDYLYIPLGGSKGSMLKKVRNTFIIFLVSGFWHGANWTFLIWGLLNAIYFLPLLVVNKNRENMNSVAVGRFFPNVKEFLSIGFTFAIVTLAWVIFRAESLDFAFEYYKGLLSFSLFIMPQQLPYILLLFLIFFIFVEWMGRESQYGLQDIALNWPKPLRWFLYLVITSLIFLWSIKEQTFIYFQF